MPDATLLLTGLLAFSLVLLGLWSRGLFGEPFQPAVVFSVTWGAVLLLIIAAAPLGFHSVSPQAAAVFVAGALCFTAGCWFGDGVARASASHPPPADAWERLDYRWIVAVGAALHVAILPLWWQEMTTIAGESSDLLVIGFQVRYKTVLGEATLGPVVGNYLVLGLITIAVLAMGVFRGRLSAWTALAISLPWLAANLVANGRSSLVQLLVALAYLRATERRPIDLRSIAAGLTMFAVIAVGGVLLVAKGNTTVEDNAATIAAGVLENISDYLLQGPVLFSRYFSGEIRISPSWDSLAFPCALLSNVGLCTPGELHQEFAEFGTRDQFGNVYSMYLWMLPKYGPLGVAIFVAAYGAWVSFHHRRHRQGGSLPHSIVAAFLFAAVPLSIFSDMFAPNLNFLIKAAVVTLLMQRLFVRATPAARAPSAGVQSSGAASAAAAAADP